MQYQYLGPHSLEVELRLLDEASADSQRLHDARRLGHTNAMSFEGRVKDAQAEFARAAHADDQMLARLPPEAAHRLLREHRVRLVAAQNAQFGGGDSDSDSSDDDPYEPFRLIEQSAAAVLFDATAHVHWQIWVDHHPNMRRSKQNTLWHMERVALDLSRS
jgi:hypothetical protein